MLKNLLLIMNHVKSAELSVSDENQWNFCTFCYYGKPNDPPLKFNEKIEDINVYSVENNDLVKVREVIEDE